MAKPTEKRVFFTRHAQAEHNLTWNWDIPDPSLTKLGRHQSEILNEDTKDTFQKTAELLVTSPLKRPMQTMLIGYPELRQRLEAEGSPREELEADPEFAGLDFSQLIDDTWRSKEGFYAPTTRALQARARWVRTWLRARPERELVVVAHGDVLRYITDGQNSTEDWANTEVREYTFLTDDVDADPDARMVPFVREAIVKEGENDPTSSSAAALPPKGERKSHWTY